MGGADEEVLDVVAVLHVTALDPAATALLGAVGGQRQRLDVAGVGDRDDHLLVGDQVLDVDLVLAGRDVGAALVGEALGDLPELLLDQVQDGLLAAEQLAQLADPLGDVGVLGLDRVGLQRGQLGEAKVEDRRCLHRGEVEVLDELLAGDVAVLGRADQLDNRVEVVEGDEEAEEDVGAVLLDPQLVLGAPHDDLALVADVGAEHFAERKGLGDAVDQRHRVDAEGGLHRRVLVELVENDLGDGVALELDHQAHAVAVRLVAQVGDLGDLLVVDEIGDLLDQPSFAALLDHVGQLGDDDRLLALGERFDVGLGLHPDAPAASLVGVTDPLPAEDGSPGREIGALNVAEELVDGDVGVVDKRDRCGDDFTQVVGRNVRCHPHGDAGRTVDQQVREAGRQHDRLLGAAVVVGHEVDRVHVEIAQHLRRQAGQARLGVPHGGGRVVVDRAEVPLAVDQRVAHREVLGETDEGVVDR